LAVILKEMMTKEKSRFTNEQIAFALKQAESGVPAAEVCRKLGASQQTFYRWKKKFGGRFRQARSNSMTKVIAQHLPSPLEIGRGMTPRCSMRLRT
jgi:transposase-like protein